MKINFPPYGQKNFIQYNLSPKTKNNLPRYIKEDYFF
nr:MAG TPA: hypothetical protein [Caudoviricetes sp.]